MLTLQETLAVLRVAFPSMLEFIILSFFFFFLSFLLCHCCYNDLPSHFMHTIYLYSLKFSHLLLIFKQQYNFAQLKTDAFLPQGSQCIFFAFQGLQLQAPWGSNFLFCTLSYIQPMFGPNKNSTKGILQGTTGSTCD